MSIESSFLSLYDKVGQTGFAEYTVSTGSFEVDEHESEATLAQLQVNCQGVVFSSFNNQLVKGMKGLTETRSTHLLDSDCDGIAFMRNEEKEGIVLVELKSRFSTQHLKKAFCQMTHSFLKMHVMLSLCREYALDSLSLHFIAACKCFENIEQEDGVYNYLSKVEKDDSTTFEGNFLRNLIKKHDIVTTLGEMTSLWGIPLSSSLANKSITLSLQLTQNYSDDKTVYSLLNI